MILTALKYLAIDQMINHICDRLIDITTPNTPSTPHTYPMTEPVMLYLRDGEQLCGCIIEVTERFVKLLHYDMCDLDWVHARVDRTEIEWYEVLLVDSIE